eukprot:GHVU01218843.1.p1 GENE.GHVU01218843.1~~GHVU01218843.1.p1  ORF type:complete len:145 (+),score=7.96 GHVU01218843.1:1388-1822(+)
MRSRYSGGENCRAVSAPAPACVSLTGSVASHDCGVLLRVALGAMQWFGRITLIHKPSKFTVQDTEEARVPLSHFGQEAQEPEHKDQYDCKLDDSINRFVDRAMRLSEERSMVVGKRAPRLVPFVRQQSVHICLLLLPPSGDESS